MDSPRLKEIGWKPCFERQLSTDESNEMLVVRVAAHFGSTILCMAANEEFSLPTGLISPCGDIAVGDWLLLEPTTLRGIRRLERESLVTRKAAGEKVQSQLIAANVDTLFIVSSCNHDFNLSRLERYLALAAEAEVFPVVVLTKADLCANPDSLRQEAMRSKSGISVLTLDARDTAQIRLLEDWCGVGQTVALVGSSGVGKSTLANSLGAENLATQPIREDDSKGRHTTTARSIHRLDAGGLLIDTPGMRELQLADCEVGVAEVFDEIMTLSDSCRFRDCTHQGEPDCAVLAAIELGELDSRRLKNYFKLLAEQERNAQSLHERHQESRRQGQFYKSVIASKRRRRGEDG
ncbi:ribosome small subunit-dependent GTPase A [Bythopirellula polymerisocia]|uniref:Small ribosomal subunit biogenesis GTPase RsgA n=1 Tax=Bythopirellula polymerisocia TaxID=2528003 RepID=A0A5C6C9N3_9BACT|nr:ribosome small subunit-dependent GTPase A [Bythopirellula polymerisocia]TWU20888.1 putative ribosome biogenesis GTPase RsgA [Bythopirellula polymerisocia]